MRRLSTQADTTFVLTGPIFEPGKNEAIGEGRVAVPTHLFKVVLTIRDSHKRMHAAIVPNQPTRAEFAKSVDEVERRTGLDLFAALDDEEEANLESAENPFTTVDDEPSFSLHLAENRAN